MELYSKDISKIVTSKKFITLNKVIAFKKISSNVLKDYFIIQVYNKRD